MNRVVTLLGAIAAAAVLSGLAQQALQAMEPLPDGELSARLERLEHELSIQRDVEDIRRLQYAYNYYNSGRLYAQVLDLISENAGKIEIAGRGVYYGKAGFAKNFHPDADGAVTDKGVEFGFILHQLAGMDVITVDADRKRANGRVRVLTTVYAGIPETRNRINGGDYEIVYVRENGKWLIHSMKYVHNFSVSHEPGGKIIPRYSAGPDGTADEPTTWYHPWPETGVLAFHFPNPVSGKYPPDVTGETRYWIGNWPGEYGKSGHHELMQDN